MRKLERQMNFAVSNKGNWSGSNTQVTYNEMTNCSSVSLHGHSIATYAHNLKALKISSCGYTTTTTIYSEPLYLIYANSPNYMLSCLSYYPFKVIYYLWNKLYRVYMKKTIFRVSLLLTITDYGELL